MTALILIVTAIVVIAAVARYATLPGRYDPRRKR